MYFAAKAARALRGARASVESLVVRGSGANPGNVRINGILQGTATWDIGSLVDAAGESKDVTVTGAALGDLALASIAVDNVDMVVTANVTAANTVTVRVQNESGSTADPASTTVKVLVIKTASSTST